MLNKGLLGPQRDGPFFVRGGEGVAREEKSHFVRRDEVRDVGEDAGEGEVVCQGNFLAGFAPQLSLSTDGSGNPLTVDGLDLEVGVDLEEHGCV